METGTQAMVVYGKERKREAYIMNRKAIALFVSRSKGVKDDKKEEL